MIRSKPIFFGLAAILCAVSSLNAVAGIPIFKNPAKAQADELKYTADNSQDDQTQYNPYMQDEDDQLNDGDIYYGGYGGAGAAGLGAAAAIGAELNEARNNDDGRHRDARAATEAAARHNRGNAERSGMSSHNNSRLNEEAHPHGGEFGEGHRGSEGRGGEGGFHGNRGMGGGHMGGHGGRR